MASIGTSSKTFQVIHGTSALALAARTVLCALAVWSAVGLVTALTLAGRRVVGLALPAVFGVWMAGALIPLCLRPEISRDIHAGLHRCLAIGLRGRGCGDVHRELAPTIDIHADVLLAALLISITLAAAFGSGWIRHEPFGYVLLLGCGVIPIPLAAAPLAVFVNRHR